MVECYAHPHHLRRILLRHILYSYRYAVPFGGLLAIALLGSSGSIAIAQTPNRSSLPPASLQSSHSIRLGVVRSSDNAAAWQAILAGIEAAGIPYSVIDWQQVQTPRDLGNVTVLFLPNVETVTAEQLLTLQSWINHGGNLIASGPIGLRSSFGVRQALHLLIGASWESALPQPVTLQPIRSDDQPWMQTSDANPARPVAGGVIRPVGVASQTVATWNAGSNAARSGYTTSTAAIVVTLQATFLGWDWGHSGAADFNGHWLRAAIGRIQQNTLSVQATQPAARASTVAATVAAATSTNTATPPPIDRSVSPTRSTVARTAVPLPARPTTVPAASLSRPSSQDPTEQVAPAELSLEANARMTLYEATTMRQELANLIGRFESALLAAHSTSEADKSAKASTTDRTVRIAAASAPDRASAVLAQSRQDLASFSQLLGAQQYAAARQLWLQAHQRLWDNFPLDRPIAQPEIRAIWLDRGTIVQAGSRQGLAQVFDRLKAAGINTVFFETVNAGYPIYPSQVAPQQNPLTRGWDPLAEAVALAHERGMELHAWVWTFAVGNSAHNRLLGLPSAYPGPVLAAHPDWASYGNQGNLFPVGQGKPFLDPANPAVRQYLLQLFQEIVTRYDVDGLQLDYIRYPFQDPGAGHAFGYGQTARQQFQQLTGIDPLSIPLYESAVPTPAGQINLRQQLWQQWTEFRTNQVNSFVAEVSKQVHQLKPNLILSVAVFPQPEQRRIEEMQQNWELWARQGDVDLIVVMCYAMDTHGMQRLANPWLSQTANLGSTLVIPGIRLLNLSDMAIVDQIQTLRDSSAGGFALFAAENLNNSGTLQTIFHHTQGEASHAADPIPYRDPFAAAASRYGSLQQEWNLLLEQGQLGIPEQRLAAWQAQVQGLKQRLDQLATHPSAQALQDTRTALVEFRSHVHTWMQPQSDDLSYRLATWENHLNALEKLLNYGERVVLGRQNSNQQVSTNSRLE